MAKTQSLKLFKDETELESKANAYFKRLEGVVALDENNLPKSNKNGFVYEICPKPPTISGLALALGFNSRAELLAYKGKYKKNILKFLTRVEEYSEALLLDKGYSTGAKFFLENSFSGWGKSGESEPDADFILEIEVE